MAREFLVSGKGANRRFAAEDPCAYVDRVLAAARQIAQEERVVFGKELSWFLIHWAWHLYQLRNEPLYDCVRGRLREFEAAMLDDAIKNGISTLPSTARKSAKKMAERLVERMRLSKELSAEIVLWGTLLLVAGRSAEARAVLAFSAPDGAPPKRWPAWKTALGILGPVAAGALAFGPRFLPHKASKASSQAVATAVELANAVPATPTPPLGASGEGPSSAPVAAATGALDDFDARDRLVEIGDRAFEVRTFRAALDSYRAAAAMTIHANELSRSEDVLYAKLRPYSSQHYLPRNDGFFAPRDIQEALPGFGFAQEVIDGQSAYIDARIKLSQLGAKVLDGNAASIARLSRECDAIKNARSPHIVDYPLGLWMYLANATGDPKTIVHCLHDCFDFVVAGSNWEAWGRLAQQHDIWDSMRTAGDSADGKALLRRICKTEIRQSVFGDYNAFKVAGDAAGRIRQGACNLVSAP